jgi:hypothetical protein
MSDIFAKSKIETAINPPVTEPDHPRGLESARQIADAIKHALKAAAEAERERLSGRVENATALAAVSLGNGNDEYLEREMLDMLHLNRFDAEIRDGNKQLIWIERSIAHYTLLKERCWPDLPSSARRMATCCCKGRAIFAGCAYRISPT